eukprot:Pgem_evm1s5154
MFKKASIVFLLNIIQYLTADSLLLHQRDFKKECIAAQNKILDVCQQGFQVKYRSSNSTKHKDD